MLQIYEIIIFVYMKFFYPFFFFLFLSCNTNVKKQSDLNIYRFENILFNSNYENIEKNRNIWEGEIGQFAAAYYSFLSVENDIDLIESDLLSFVENSDMREVYDSIKVKFSTLESYELEMSKAFKNFNNLFPQYNRPKFISMFSGFNYGVIVQDSIVAIGLDFYLGKNSVFYKRLADPEYLKYQKQSRFLVPNVMEAWYDSFFNHTNDNINFLSELLYRGKIMFLMSETMPKTSLERLLRYSSTDLSWCQNSEASIWAFLIENDLLFSTRQKDYRSYLYHAPFSKGMPQESPSRIAYYIGYKIINSFMQNNREVTLDELMNYTDYNSILNKSKYKP